MVKLAMAAFILWHFSHDRKQFINAGIVLGLASLISYVAF